MLKKIFRRVRKGLKDIGSFAEEHSGIANPELALMALTLGMSGAAPGGKPFGLKTLFGNLGKAGTIGKNLLGRTSSVIPEGSFAGHRDPGGGFLGTAEKLLGGGGIKDLLPFLNAFLAKKQYDQEREDILREQEEQRKKYEYVSDKYGSPTGGSPFVDDRFETYQPFQYDSDGRIIKSAKGGIAQLNMGGNPYQNNMMKLPVRRAMGGESTGVPGLTGDMSSNQMMNKIEDNPGITAFFPPRMGMISGPGGPKDDKIPAMLSDGEFVFTAKAVDNAGGPKAMYNMMNKLDPESSKGRGII